MLIYKKLLLRPCKIYKIKLLLSMLKTLNSRCLHHPSLQWQPVAEEKGALRPEGGEGLVQTEKIKKKPVLGWAF